MKAAIGHWEGDTIIGAQHQGALLTMVERVSKMTRIRPLPRKTAQGVHLILQQMGRLFKRSTAPLLTMTFDNGKEFAQHQQMTQQLKLDCYFAKPYHSWERGLNEHTNGLIRQYFPKSSSLLKVSLQPCLAIENALNDRPQKVLNDYTPREVFNQHKLF